MASEDKEAEEEVKIEDLAHRYRQAERQTLRDRPPEKKREWQKTRCTHCGYKIQYIPTDEWRGRLRCPDCGEIFDVPSENESGPTGPTLDDFIKEKGEGI